MWRRTRKLPRAAGCHQTDTFRQKRRETGGFGATRLWLGGRAIIAPVKRLLRWIRTRLPRDRAKRTLILAIVTSALFHLLFFVPFFGMAIGAGLGALMAKVEKSGIDREFQAQVRDLLQPGTSALFLVVEKVTPDKAVEALSKYGGTVLESSLSKDAEAELQEELHGSKEPVAV